MSIYINTAVRVSYPERGDYDWHQALAMYQDIGMVEVAFYRPDLFLAEVQESDVTAPFSTLPLRVTSVHMAQARIVEFSAFVQVLRKTISIAQALDCSLIIVHPTSGRLAEVEGKIAAVVDPLLEQSDVMLCWETFPGRRRFLSGIKGIAAFCRKREHHAVCYDTSHLHKPQAEVLADITNYRDCIRCFHLSNRDAAGRQQHLPLQHPDGVLDFEEILTSIGRYSSSGPLTLEYLSQFHDQLVGDALWAESELKPTLMFRAMWEDGRKYSLSYADVFRARRMHQQIDLAPRDKGE